MKKTRCLKWQKQLSPICCNVMQSILRDDMNCSSTCTQNLNKIMRLGALDCLPSQPGRGHFTAGGLFQQNTPVGLVFLWKKTKPATFSVDQCNFTVQLGPRNELFVWHAWIIYGLVKNQNRAYMCSRSYGVISHYRPKHVRLIGINATNFRFN